MKPLRMVSAIVALATACGGSGGGGTPTSTQCPKEAPAITDSMAGADNGPCDLVDGTDCGWSYPCPPGMIGGSGVSMRCSAGRWRFGSGGGFCAPAADSGPPCPASTPAPGSACSPGSFCTYLDDCNAGRDDQYTCSGGGTWSVATGKYAVACPTSAPASGDPCPCVLHLPSSCAWGCVTGSCSPSTRKWTIATSTTDAGAADADACAPEDASSDGG